MLIANYQKTHLQLYQKRIVLGIEFNPGVGAYNFTEKLDDTDESEEDTNV